MNVVRSTEELPPEAAGAVVTLGVFDGVHRGHQAVISRTVARARELNVASALVTFDVHPEEVLSKSAPCALTSLEHQLALIGELDITQALVLEFTEALAAMPAEEFARSVFRDGFRAQVVVMGREGRFGRDGAGTPEKLARWAKPWGLRVELVESVLVEGRSVSSTRIRQVVLRGEMEDAALLLGRPFSVLGTVVRGAGKGRTLGFPTGNLDPGQEACPRGGVYVGRVKLDGKWRAAAVVVGGKPTFETESRGPAHRTIEVHVLDFHGDLLGQHLEVQFLAFLRELARFPDAQALSNRIERDVAQVRAYFREHASATRKPAAAP